MSGYLCHYLLSASVEDWKQRSIEVHSEVASVPFSKLPCLSASRHSTRGHLRVNLMHKHSKEEYQFKAEQAAINIRYAVNKKLAVHAFLNYLYLSI